MNDLGEQMAYEAGLDTSRGGSCLTESDLCEDCGHAISLHADMYGCEYERDDVWVEGTNCGGLVAAGPCGCKSHAELRIKP